MEKDTLHSLLMEMNAYFEKDKAEHVMYSFVLGTPNKGVFHC